MDNISLRSGQSGSSAGSHVVATTKITNASASNIPLNAAKRGLAEKHGAINRQLLSAANRGRTGEVSELLAAKADVNAANGAGETALCHTVRNNHVRAAQILLTAKANPNLRCSAPFFETALDFAGPGTEVGYLLRHNGAQCSADLGEPPGGLQRYRGGLGPPPPPKCCCIVQTPACSADRSLCGDPQVAGERL
eukprot:gnl/MRDRNA2_/MRDRNA2_122200_c0_seq1.p1 gnl/MRDRNA2_/MRDRNA2_122200_c0~~gnl/MRDRNA2_/MRDRNA2_122200_c0_seq1.p1  ORF type:complete len:194 (+),score=26.58 gnl/MRDRNA2_/MRDRNA2_122200_c0_seq1:105-686(+)